MAETVTVRVVAPYQWDLLRQMRRLLTPASEVSYIMSVGWCVTYADGH